MEGGWTDDPIDPGGPTNKGITLAELARWDRAEVSSDTVPALRSRLRAIDKATVRQIYRANYWQPACCADLPAPIALFHFDASVNQGVSRTTRFPSPALATSSALISSCDIV